MTGQGASHQSEDPEWLPEELSTVDLPTGSINAQRRTATGINQTTIEVKHDTISDSANCGKESMKDDCEYTIYHIVRNVSKGANSRYVIRCYVYTAADDTIQQVVSITTHSIEKVEKKAKTKA